MSDKETVTLTREQFDAWIEKKIAPDVGVYSIPKSSYFDSLKSFVEKPKRRFWYLSICESVSHGLVVRKYLSDASDIRVTETFEGDVIKTKDEARSWVLGAFDETPSNQPVEQFRRSFLEALGLED